MNDLLENDFLLQIGAVVNSLPVPRAPQVEQWRADEADVQEVFDACMALPAADPNACINLPSWFHNQREEVPLVFAFCWYPSCVKKLLDMGATVPQHSKQWHNFLAFSWVNWEKFEWSPPSTPKRPHDVVDEWAARFAQSLALLQGAGYDFAQYKDPHKAKNTRLSFLHTLYWAAQDKECGDVVLRHCIEQGITVSDDVIGDVRCVQQTTHTNPKCAQVIQHYVLTQATNMATHVSDKRKI